MYIKRRNEQNKKATYRMEEIFPNHISDKGLIYRINKELLQLNNNKIIHFKNVLRI